MMLASKCSVPAQAGCVLRVLNTYVGKGYMFTGGSASRLPRKPTPNQQNVDLVWVFQDQNAPQIDICRFMRDF